MKPDAFAAVMATGIVSIAAADHGFQVASDVLVVLAAAAFPVLIVMVARAWRGFDLRDPHGECDGQSQPVGIRSGQSG